MFTKDISNSRLGNVKNVNKLTSWHAQGNSPWRSGNKIFDSCILL